MRMAPLNPPTPEPKKTNTVMLADLHHQAWRVASEVTQTAYSRSRSDQRRRMRTLSICRVQRASPWTCLLLLIHLFLNTQVTVNMVISQRDSAGAVTCPWSGAKGQLFNALQENEPSKLEKLQNVANKNCFYQDTTNFKVNPTPQIKDGVYMTHLQISLQIVPLQSLEGAGIYLHRFGMEDHLNGHEIRQNFLWGDKPGSATLSGQPWGHLRHGQTRRWGLSCPCGAGPWQGISMYYFKLVYFCLNT